MYTKHTYTYTCGLVTVVWAGSPEDVEPVVHAVVCRGGRRVGRHHTREPRLGVFDRAVRAARRRRLRTSK